MEQRALDEAIQVLQGHKEAWAKLPPDKKADHVQGIMDGYRKVAAGMVEASNQAKGMAPGTPMGGEEWTHPYIIMRTLRLVRDSLRATGAPGGPPLPKGVRQRANGQVAVRVFPLNTPDKLIYQGYRGEVWMQPGVTPENLKEAMGGAARAHSGKVALVLGAGNVASAGPSDLVHKLFVEGQVCLYKHNPVNEYLAPFLEQAFSQLIRGGYMRTARGGADVGEYLCQHPGIEEIHLTGSDRTYEAIVFGTGEEGRQRKQRGELRINKRSTCELGNISPIIVAPGDWSESDICFQAQNIATMMTNNCGFNCLTGRMLVLQEGWSHGAALLRAIHKILEAAPQRKAYYPGAERHYDEIIAANPTARAIGARSPGVIPYTLVPDLDPAHRENVCFRTECFMPLLGQTAVPGADPAEFLRNAATFCNESLWGTLCAHVVMHPSTQRALGDAAVEQTLADLRYGTVCLNQWAALSYAWAAPSWGAFPGHTPTDIQSGIGTVHNTFMFDQPQKSVLFGPFRSWPKPPWYITNKNTHGVFPRMVPLEAKPSLGKTMAIAMAAMKG